MMTDKSFQQQSFPQPGPPQAKGRVFTRYTIVWVSLAALSTLYLGLVLAKPATVASVLGAGGGGTDADAKLGETVAEVRSLRDTIDLFRNELIEVRAQLSAQTQAARDLTSRVATIETQTAEAARVASEAAAKDPKALKLAKAKAAEKGAEPAERTAMATPAEKAAEKKAADKKDAAAKKAAQKSLETGSVDQAQPAAPPISFGPPTVTTTVPVPPGPGASLNAGSNGSGPFAVQIATGPSVDSLRLSWTLLNERHGSTLSALEPRYKTDTADGETSYDLVVGPVADADAARRLCQELAVKATPCAVSRFTGSAL